VLTLAERVGLHDLVDEHVWVPGSVGSNPAAKIAALIAGVAPACFTVARASATGSEAPFGERVEPCGGVKPRSTVRLGGRDDCEERIEALAP
jgi:hypothetical protein